jgi:hypothetical protein
VHQDLQRAVETLGLPGKLPTLTAAAARSRQTIEAAREWLIARIPLEDARKLDVVVHGSFARMEATPESDFDYLIVAHGLPEDVRVMRALLRAVDSFIAERLTTGDEQPDKRRPGRTGLFGHIASAPGLTERIGLEQDTNVSTTRRLLVLEESVSIYRPDRRLELLRAILERYLFDYPAQRKEGVPRFLLNDVTRYWYTLAVDYQAKRWEGDDQGWGLRYLKLLISRKLTYAGTITSLLLCGEDRPASVDHLTAEFEKPPLARLAQLADHGSFDQHDALREVLLIAERFAASLASAEVREAAASVTSPSGMIEDPLLGPIREDADLLHEMLGKVLFDSFLVDRARRYLVL